MPNGPTVAGVRTGSEEMMSALSWFLHEQRTRCYRRGIAGPHHLRRHLAYYVAEHGFVIGDYSAGQPNIMLYNRSRLKVGKYSNIAAGVHFIMGGPHATHAVATRPSEHGPGSSVPDIVVGSDVWIGGNTMVLSGVTIGDGAVVGVGSVVTDDVPPYSVALGNPAQTVGKRFSDDLVGSLLDLRWWDLDHARVQSLRPLLSRPDIEPFVEECRRLKGLPPAPQKAIVRKASAPPDAVATEIVAPRGGHPAEAEIRAWCVGFLAKELKQPPAQVDPATRFKRLGIDSTTSVIFSIDLGEWLGLELSPSLMFDYPTINDLARHLADDARAGGANAARGGRDG